MIEIVLITLGAFITIMIITVGCYFLGKSSPRYILLGVTLVMLIYVLLLALLAYRRIISL